METKASETTGNDRKMKWYNSIRFKIILSVVLTALVVDGIFFYLRLRLQENNLNETILRTATLLSRTIENSLTSEMLEHHPENPQRRERHAYRVIEAIRGQEGIERVRIYSGEGRIIFSSNKEEEGRVVGTATEACASCHAQARPLGDMPHTDRSRILDSGRGYRVLNMIHPLFNRKECSTGDCHVHPQSMKVLGVIDVGMSLANVDSILQNARKQVAFFNMASIAAISMILVVVLIGAIGKPVEELSFGTKRVADGDLEHEIPVTSNDEMGHLARSFNQMTEHLRKANIEIQEWIRNLESKVEERSAELKAAQEQLLHTEKLAAMGRIAATVAHEINNPLAGVYTYIRLMERKIQGGATGPADIAKYQEYLSTMGREVERTTAIVSNLLDLTRPKDPVRKSVSIEKVIRDSLSIIQNLLKINNVTVGCVVRDVPDIFADPAQIKQVFINLFVNAGEAMEGGGILSIQAFRKESDHMVTVEVQDSGVGIPPGHLARIFDAFFTTKEKGTGLGLSVVKGIIERHGGSIEIESEVGKGTLVRIKLPVE